MIALGVGLGLVVVVDANEVLVGCCCCDDVVSEVLVRASDFQCAKDAKRKCQRAPQQSLGRDLLQSDIA